MRILLYSTCIVTALGAAALSSIAIADPMKAETNHINQQMTQNMTSANQGTITSHTTLSNDHNHDHHDHDHHEHDHHEHDHHDHDHHDHDHHDHHHHDHHHHHGYHPRLVDINVGPIWNNNEAPSKCYPACHASGGHWHGQWHTVQAAQSSVCECEI